MLTRLRSEKTNPSLRFRGAHVRPAWRYLVEYHVESLNALTAISKAEIVLQRQGPSRLPYRVQIVVSLPGPEIQAAASDHTFQAALLKTMKKIRAQIMAQLIKRPARKRVPRPLPLAPDPRPGETL